MNKLYWIVCDDQETNLFEGRYQGRTRGEALKFLKQSLGRRTLNGLAYTITEIPVPLIREIVAEILAEGEVATTPTANVVPISQPVPETSPERYDAFADAVQPDPEPAETPPSSTRSSTATNKVGNPGLGDEFWAEVKAHWLGCRSIKQTAMHFGISPNSLKTRSRREGWGK
jgi:hypothetical protein